MKIASIQKVTLESPKQSQSLTGLVNAITKVKGVIIDRNKAIKLK